MLTGAIISIVLFTLLLIGAVAISQLAAEAGYTDIVVLYNVLTIFSIVAIVLAIIVIVAACDRGAAFKRKRWAVITSAILDLLIGVIGIIGAIKVAATLFTYIMYFAVFCAGLAIFDDLFKANKALQQEAYETQIVANRFIPSEPMPTPTPVQPAQTTLEKAPLRDKLIEAKALFEEGLITEQEYTERKQNLLSNEDKK